MGGRLAYHVYVVTALESGVMRIQSDVLKTGPNAYLYGYAWRAFTSGRPRREP